MRTSEQNVGGCGAAQGAEDARVAEGIHLVVFCRLCGRIERIVHQREMRKIECEGGKDELGGERGVPLWDLGA